MILGNHGVINSFLFSTGLRAHDHPLSFLLYSRFAVMLVLGYVWLPFVALPIFVTLENLDRRLLEAASDLYASRLQAFLRVTLPLSPAGSRGRLPLRLHPDRRRVRHPVARRRLQWLHVREPDRRSLPARFPDWETGAVLSLFLLAVTLMLTLIFVRFLRVSEARTT